jgi:hypothetical protein
VAAKLDAIQITFLNVVLLVKPVNMALAPLVRNVGIYLVHHLNLNPDLDQFNLVDGN